MTQPLSNQNAPVIHIEVLNLASFVREWEQQYPQAVRTAAGDGIQKAGEFFADDVSAHTPVLTGKAAASIRNQMRGPLTVVIDYDPKEAFYMRFVQLGAKPHDIGTRRGRRQKRTSMKSTLAMTMPDYNAVIPLGNDRRMALSLVVGGEHIFRASVHHPGIKGQYILTERLGAMQANLVGIVRTALDKELQKAKSFDATSSPLEKLIGR